jgi:hypothetical protein
MSQFAQLLGMIARPPSDAEWLVDGLEHGHTHAEVLAMASWRKDFADELAEQRRRDRRPIRH